MKSEKMIFKNQEYKTFYQNYLKKCRMQDAYHKALVYCLGISGDARYLWEAVRVRYPKYCS